MSTLLQSYEVLQRRVGELAQTVADEHGSGVFGMILPGGAGQPDVPSIGEAAGQRHPEGELVVIVATGAAAAALAGPLRRELDAYVMAKREERPRIQLL